MASFKKTANGWQAQVARKGIRKSKILPTKQEARDWAARQERLILEGQAGHSDATLSDAFDRYANEVSPKKRGERWEVIRLKKFKRLSIAGKRISEIEPKHIAEWRDEALKTLAPASVHREMELMSGVFAVAKREWGWVGASPMEGVKRPPKGPPRDRRVQPCELEALTIAAGDDLSTATARTFHAFLFAIETAMRSGELVGLEWKHIDLASRVAHLPMTKNGSARDVPLSREAVRLLKALPRMDPVFGLTSQQRDILWRKVRDRAGVKDLRFHDARHEAITRLARKLDILDLARMVGHKNISQLQTYYNATAAEIAERLG